MPYSVTIKLSYEQVNVLDKLVCIAISQWPIYIFEVDEDLLSLHAKVMLALDEFER